MTTENAVRLAVAFLMAVALTAVLGSILQTQINLASIAALGADVPPALRAAVTGQDLMGFGPVMAGLAAAAFLPAFSIAGLAARFMPFLRVALHAGAGFVGLWFAFWAMGFFTPMPTLIAAVRGVPGLAAMSATGLLGGLVFALISRRGPARTAARPA